MPTILHSFLLREWPKATTNRDRGYVAASCVSDVEMAPRFRQSPDERTSRPTAHRSAVIHAQSAIGTYARDGDEDERI